MAKLILTKVSPIVQSVRALDDYTEVPGSNLHKGENKNFQTLGGVTVNYRESSFGKRTKLTLGPRPTGLYGVVGGLNWRHYSYSSTTVVGRLVRTLPNIK